MGESLILLWAVTLEPRDWVTAIGTLLLIVGGVAGLAAYFKYRYSDETHRADGESIETWKGLAASRLAALQEAREENKLLQDEVNELKTDLGECEKLRNDFALFNLRLQAKNANYEKCIHRLEDKLNLPLTKFDDPTPANFGR